jgi:hypothetical protein
VEGIIYINRKRIETGGLIDIEKLQGRLGKIGTIYTTKQLIASEETILPIIYQAPTENLLYESDVKISENLGT